MQCCTSECGLTFRSASVGRTGASTSRLTVPAEFSDQSAANSHTGPTPARWSVMRVYNSGACIRAIVPSSVILEQKTSLVLVETVATAGTLTSHPNFNRTCMVTAGAKLSISFAL